MSPYKSFLNATRSYFATNGFLKFLLSIHIVVFAVGGVLFVIGSFLYGFGGDFFSCIGLIIMLAGLLLTILKEDTFWLVIISGIISLGCLSAWIMWLAIYGGFGFNFTSFFYFLAFGAIALLVFLKSERFKQIRAAAAVKQIPGAPCPRCGGFVPMSAGFCPTCGAPNTPPQPQYVPPAQQYAPPAQQYAPPVQPEPVSEPVTPKCTNCGANVTPGAAFCAHCGAKQ